jgi:hypothetical protein
LIKLNQSLTGQSVTKLKLTNIISTGANTYTAIPVIELTKTAPIGSGTTKNKSFAPIYITTSVGPTPTAGTIIGCSTGGAGAAAGVLPPLVVEGDACTPDGAIGHDATGALLSCQGGVWGPSKNYKGYATIAFAMNYYPPSYGPLPLGECNIELNNGTGATYSNFRANLSTGNATSGYPNVAKCVIGNGFRELSLADVHSDSAATLATVPYLFECVAVGSTPITYKFINPPVGCVGISGSNFGVANGRIQLLLLSPMCNLLFASWNDVTTSTPAFNTSMSVICKYK